MVYWLCSAWATVTGKHSQGVFTQILICPMNCVKKAYILSTNLLWKLKLLLWVVCKSVLSLLVQSP